jgi:hypothetical protein
MERRSADFLKPNLAASEGKCGLQAPIGDIQIRIRSGAGVQEAQHAPLG